MITLQNEYLRASIHPKGAELQELVNLGTRLNYMWRGDAAYWGKFSPVLFPIVGALKDNTYFYNGRPYTLPRHGFARDMVFAAEQSNETTAIFTLEHTEASLKVYPFAFRLQLRYRLEGEAIVCRYVVENPGSEPLWFSAGGHPAFAVPLVGHRIETAYEDYSLLFNRSTTLTRYKLADGLISDATETIALEHGALPLRTDLFTEDALVLKGVPDTAITLKCSRHHHGLEFTWEGFPFFGIWAAPNAPFVCLEPWCGIADHVDHDQQLITKEGIQRIEPGQAWFREWRVRTF
jgi:galactose mutarotase-like enzyme